MLPELRERFDAIEQRRHTLLARLGALDQALVSYHPRQGSWSMLQVAQHLMLVEKLLITSMTREQRPVVKIRWWNRIGRWLLGLVYRHGIRVPAPTRKVIPIAEPPLRATARDWEALRLRLRTFLEITTPEGARKLGFRHPVSGPHDVAETLDFMRMHFDHHMRQIARIEASAVRRQITGSAA